MDTYKTDTYIHAQYQYIKVHKPIIAIIVTSKMHALTHVQQRYNALFGIFILRLRHSSIYVHKKEMHLNAEKDSKFTENVHKSPLLLFASVLSHFSFYTKTVCFIAGYKFVSISIYAQTR